MTVRVGCSRNSHTCLVPFVIYSTIGAVSPSGHFFAMTLTVCKPNRIRDEGPRTSPPPLPSAHFSALIPSLQCTHPIQLGGVMGLVRRVKICTHFSPVGHHHQSNYHVGPDLMSPAPPPLSVYLFFNARLTVFFSAWLYFTV